MVHRAKTTDPGGHCRQRPHRGGQRNALKLASQRREPFDRRHQLHPAPVRHEVVDFIEDDAAHPAQGAAAGLARHQQVQALGRRDENFRGPAQHRRALRGTGVAAARLGAQCRQCLARGRECRGELRERFNEIALDVSVQRFQRRDVQHPRGAGGVVAGDEAVQCPKKGGQRLAAAGGGGDQRVPAGGDDRPRLCLRVGRRRITSGKPRGDTRVKQAQRLVPGGVWRGVPARRTGHGQFNHGALPRMTLCARMVAA